MKSPEKNNANRPLNLPGKGVIQPRSLHYVQRTYVLSLSMVYLKLQRMAKGKRSFHRKMVRLKLECKRGTKTNY
jgi:hypothetical protein